MEGYGIAQFGAPLEKTVKPTPVPTGRQVHLAITHAGVCYIDLHVQEGCYDLGSRGKLEFVGRGVSLPVIPGHEIVGKVVSRGLEAEGAGLEVGKTLTLQGSMLGGLSNLHEVVALAKKGVLPPIPIDHRPMNGASGALDDLRNGKISGGSFCLTMLLSIDPRLRALRQIFDQDNEECPISLTPSSPLAAGMGIKLVGTSHGKFERAVHEIRLH